MTWVWPYARSFVWRHRFAKHRLAGLKDHPKCPPPRQYHADIQVRLLVLACQKPSEVDPTRAGQTHWSIQDLAHYERLLDTERLSHACSLETSRFERLQQPIVLGDRRVSALRFGDPRIHALVQAITRFSLIPEGFQNRDVRPLVAALLGRELEAYSRGAMTYDLRRLRLHGLIQRVPHSHRYIVTLDGLQIAAFYNTLFHHVLRPGWAVLAQPHLDTPAPLDRAVPHLAAVTSDLFHHVHPKPETSAAAA